MVNSGSSANLLEHMSCKFKKNSEIITILTFSTTVAPIYQIDVYCFIDVERNFYIADIKQIENVFD